MTQSIEIKGLKELKRNLRALPTILQDKVLLAGTREAANAIAAQAKSNAPIGRGTLTYRKGKIRIGNLRSSITVVQTRNPSTGEIGFAVTLAKGSTGRKYAHLVEFGTKAHEISARTLNYLRRVVRNGQEIVDIAVLAIPGGRFVRHVHHPGSRSRPFMAPALDQAYTYAIDRMVAKVNQKIEQLGGSFRTR